MSVAGTYCERCGSELSPASPDRCICCESVAKVVAEQGGDEDAILAGRRALNAPHRLARAQGITREEAKARLDAEEEAVWDAILASDPTIICERCGSPLNAADEPCSMCRAAARLASEQGKTPEEVADQLAFTKRSNKRMRAERAQRPPDDVARESAEAHQRLNRQWAGELPPSISPLEATVTLPCNHIHASGTFKKTQLHFTANGVLCKAEKSRTASYWTPWNAIHTVTVEAADNVKQRVTAPRVAAGGIFALGFKKTYERSYVIVTATHGEESIFEITGLSTMDTRARLGPVTAWLQTYGEDIRAPAFT